MAGLTVVLVGGLAVGLWWITSPQLPETDRLAFAVLVAFFGLVAGGAAFGLGLFAGRLAERDSARRAAEAQRIRHQRIDAQLASRRAEREQIAARLAENPRLPGGPPE